MKRGMKMGQEHEAACSCWRCYAATLGAWLDDLGARTICGCWILFVTISYRTPNYPWGRGFPIVGLGKPSSDFGHRLFDRFVEHLEGDLGCRVDFVVADDFGSLHGRYHQHALLAAIGLAGYSRREIEGWLKVNAGWSRVLPFRGRAARYLAKNIGRKLETADWRVEVGGPRTLTAAKVGRTVIATSASVPGDLFHQTFSRRKR